MKNSNKLKQQINKIIQDKLFEHSLVIDAEFRSDRISQSWKAIHESFSNISVLLPSLVSSEIESYRA